MKRMTRFAGGGPNATGLRTVVGNHVMDHCEPGLTCMNKDFQGRLACRAWQQY